MKYILICLGLLVFSSSIHAQITTPVDREIVNAQSRTAALFRLALENNMPDSAEKFIDKKYLAKNPILKQELIRMSTMLSHIKHTCLPRYSNITYRDSVTIFVFQYTIPPPRFTLSLFFEKGNKNSRIMLVNFKSQEELDEEKRKSGDVIPPPPPPPSPMRK